MRMLNQEERAELEYLQDVAHGAPRRETFCEIDPIRGRARAVLLELGMMTHETLTKFGGAINYRGHITEAGVRALRVDALIRSWGVTT